MFLKELAELSGVSGNEYEVRNYIKNKLEEIGCNYNIDRLGNIIVHNVGRKGNKTIMLTAHMDEVGFIVTAIDNDGFLKFKKVGDIDNRILIAKAVEVGENKINGVIGSKAIHLKKREERGMAVESEELYIDIGSVSKSDTEKVVNIGDYISFKSDYVEFGESMIKAKAIEGRIGCSLLLSLLKEKLDIDFYIAFTVMEKLGPNLDEICSLGAKVASYNVSPDISIVVGGTISADMPKVKEHEKVTTLGCGPVISIMDEKTIYDLELIEHIKEIAETNSIPFQLRKGTSGSNAAGVIHTRRSGSKVAAISVPCRYTNSPVSVANKTDYENAYKLLLKTTMSFNSA